MKSRKKPKVDNRIVSYSQNKEDIVLSAFFPDIEHGFYVDVGAHHPINDSVTKYFYEKGWHGINVEPNKKFYKLLVEDRPNDINVNVGIADKTGTLNFREYVDGDGLSTFSNEMQSKYEKESSEFTDNYVDHSIPVVTLKQLFEDNNVDTIHFLKVDIEGFEYEALVGNDWKKYRPEVVCVEANHMIKDWKKLLKENEYKLVFDDGLNEYYASSKERGDKFSYVENAINKTVIYFEDNQNLIEYEQLQKKFKQNLDKQADIEHQFLREIVHRDTIINESRRFKNSLVIFLKALDNVILVHINLLNHPKRKHATKNIAINDNITKKSTEELLLLAHKNDLQNFYSTKKGSGQFEKQYIFSIVLYIYESTKKIAKWVINKLAKVAGWVKSKGK